MKEAPIAVFQEKTVPNGTRLAGWAALVHALAIPAPVRRPSCVSEQHVSGSRREEGPGPSSTSATGPATAFADHLTFALRHEDIDLLILKRVFEAVPQAEVEAIVRAAPTGIPARRAWYLYETLTGRTLDVEDAPRAAAIDLLDPKAYFTGKPRLSKRHRVRDNLLWAPAGSVRSSGAPRLSRNSWNSTSPPRRGKPSGRTGAHLVARAASFMLLADSRASFEIEGERPPRNRLERWGRAVLQAGKNRLTLDEIIRLHGVLIEDTRFVQRGPASRRRVPGRTRPPRRPAAGIHRRAA